MFESARKYSIGLWALEGVADRFVPGGYEDPRTPMEALDVLGDVDGMNGVQFLSTDFDEHGVDPIKDRVEANDLTSVAVLMNSFTPNWKLGALTATDESLRQEAIDYGKQTVEYADQLGADEVTLWLGTEGFDYPFQIEYSEHWDLLIDGIQQIAEHDSSKEIALEYKLKEPRKHMTIGSAMKGMYISRSVDVDNVGVVVDFGHALMGKENVAESIALLDREDCLSRMEFNDAYREWDDDMVAGSVNLWDGMEFLYYLDRVDYDGWLCFDIFPFRMDSKQAAQICVDNTDKMIELVERIDRDRLEQAQQDMDAAQVQKLLFDIL